MSKMADLTENYQLKWHSFSSHLHSCVASALTKENFGDVYLYTIDGRRILAHRFVLSASSQYLHDILKLQQKMPTTLPLVIVLPPEINFKTLSILIQYMYSGETTVSKDVLESVLRGGDLLKVKGLWRPTEERYFERKLVKIHERDVARYATNGQLDPNNDNSLTAITEPKILETPTAKHKDGGKSGLNSLPVKVIVSEEKSVCGSVENDDLVQERRLGATEKENSKGKPSADIDKTTVEFAEDHSEVDNLRFLVIKEEPIEWSELNESEMEMIEEGDMFHTEMTIKPEVVLNDQEEKPEELYSPLTCELCAETFTLPAEWVRHIQTHTDMLPAKRQKRGKLNEDDNGTFPPLHCDMCQKYFPTPAEWVHHIQNAHTEFELRVSNKTNPSRPVRVNRQVGSSHKTCVVCSKKFPSHASMLIHRRTHTGEKPYMCEHCQKGFNVKSNLLRHLRTLHDRIVNSTDIENREVSMLAGSSNA